ncbi:flagellar export chaperone FliS [Rossellomorea marisflavi]|uniref:flagellar export chaperone FliS n=1 Tax=Rossellomorea marisflavi TaxID=189381 RepID=UPI003457BEC0
MTITNPYKTYQDNSVTTASPGELTLMLYNGCLKFIHLAKVAIDNNEIESKNTNIQKAQKIISELMSTLNVESEVTKGMLSLYEFSNHKLFSANIRSDINELQEAQAIITEFRDAWKQAIQLNRQKQYAGSDGRA